MDRTGSRVGFRTASDEGGADLQYRILGPVQVVRDEQVIDLGVLKQRALLALLLIHANDVVSTDRIIDELWNDAGREKERSLWVVVSRLRTALEPDRPKRSEGSILLSRSPGYSLSVVPQDIDAVQFSTLATEGRALIETDPAAASLVLSEALGLWRGHALEEFTYEPFAEAEVSRLEELRLAALEDRIDADLRAGRTRELVGELESLVRQHPVRERMAGHLMLALHLSGRQGESLRAFSAFRTYLADELGLEPSAQISRLEERILLDDPDLRSVGAARALSGRAEPGLSVRGYELREKTGSDAMGRVYSAFQPAVGREVAIKVIRPDLANDPTFIRRFEAEAQLVARLEHPRIVPVFDYWREQDSAYLVTRRFEGGTLLDFAESDGLTPEIAIEVVTQVGGALAAAHRRRVAHGDLRPESVFIDSDGNAYLGNFGMSWSVRGAEGFTAPEQQPGEEVTWRADLYSLGRLAEYAFASTDLDVSDVIAKATSTSPADRFDDVDSFLAALRASLGVQPKSPSADLVNPYRGLHAFDESDSERFFGRERLIERLITRLGRSGAVGRFVAVVGPSGSGKSSVVRAGVVPALRSGAAPGSDHWFIATTIPGRHPFEALESSLRSIAVDPPADLRERLSTDGIAATVRGLLADTSAQILLVIDQLEELFSLASPHDAMLFMNAIVKAANERNSPVKVIATLRADFYDHPLRHEAFGELVRLGTEVITPMSAQELERAITGPAAEVGVSFEAGLAAAVASDMVGQSTALPLLQYALTELFDRRKGSAVTMEAYHELGGVSGALARRAEGIYEGLDREDRARVRDVFLRLVTLNEGVGDTRRRALVSELSDAAVGNCGEVLEAFGRHRLLSFDRDAATRGPTVEIAHEALLNEWSRLRLWVSDARIDIGAQRQLESAAKDWQANDSDSDFLLSGARLARYDGWSEQPPVPLTAMERQYLVDSSAADAAELQTERQRVTKLRRLVMGVGCALVAALIAGAFAFHQQARAQDQAAVALAAVSDAQLAALVSNSAAARDDEPNLAMLLALEAHAREPNATTEQAVLSAVSSAANGARVATTARLSDDCTGSSILFSVGGLLREAATVNGVMTVRNPVTGEILGEVAPPAPCTLGGAGEDTGTAQSLDGQTVWLGPDLDVVVELDLPDGAQVQQSIGTGLDEHVLLFEQASATELTPGRALIVSQRSGETIGEPIVGTAALPLFVEWSPEQSPDGTFFAMGFAAVDADDGELVVAEATTGTVVTRVRLPTCCPVIAWQAATGNLALGFQDGLIWTLDPESGEVLTETMLDLQRGPLTLGVEPGGALVVVASNQILLVDRDGGILAPPIPVQNANEALVSPEGLVLIANDEDTLEIFDPFARVLTTEIEFGRLERVGIVDGAAGVRSLDSEEPAAVIDLASGERTSVQLTLPDGSSFVAGVVYPAPGGVWAVSPDHILARWEDGEMVESLNLGSGDDVVSLVYGDLKPAGTRWGDFYAATGVRADGSTEATLASIRPGESEILLRVPSPGAQWAHPTSDGGIYVHGDDQVLRVYGSDGQLLEEWPTGANDPYGFSLDPTGTRLAFGDLGGRRRDLSEEEPQILILDTLTGSVDVVPQEGIVSTISFNGDGTKVILAMFDGTVRFWDTEAGGVPTIVWTGSGTFDSEPGWYDESTDSIWTSAGGNLINIPLDPANWVERACSVVGRELTQDEWDRLVPGDEPLRSACDIR